MKIKDLTFAIKKGQPNYGSISAGMTVDVSDENIGLVFNGDKLDKVWDYMKTELDRQCSPDQSWIDKKQPNETVQKPSDVLKKGGEQHGSME